jgi:hypothetical protein
LESSFAAVARSAVGSMLLVAAGVSERSRRGGGSVKM